MTIFLLAVLIWISFGAIVYMIITSSKFSGEIIAGIKKHPDSLVHSEPLIWESISSPGFLILCLILAFPMFFILVPYTIFKKLKGDNLE